MSTASSTRIPVLVLAGPTASGKTDLLLELFGGGGRSVFPPAEVVSADSMQAYRGMDIGTAKPDAALRASLPHRLVDILDPSEQYSAGDFVRLADEACAEIASGGGLPVVSGGTGFYLRNFILGLPTSPVSDPAMREAVARDFAEKGRAALRAELEALDPAAAARINPTDSYRLQRALEILRATGRPLSDFAPPGLGRGGQALAAAQGGAAAPAGVSGAAGAAQAGPAADLGAASGEGRPSYRFLVACVERPREDLYARIDARVDAMFAAGLPEEFARLRAAGYGREAPGMKAIGYSEFFEAEAEGADLRSEAGLARVAEAVKLHSRRYAKRQETFFRGLPGLVRVPAEGAAAALASLLAAFLAEGA